MIGQKKYNSQNAAKLTLSPYIQAYGLGTGRLLLLRNDLGKRLIIETDTPELPTILFDQLKEGITEFSLTKLLSSYGITDTAQWLQICVENGVVE